MGASTIVVAREDLSFPGGTDAGTGRAAGSAGDIEARFFNVVRQHHPDVIVLDLTGSPSNGTAAIHKIRRQTGVPILVVCEADDPLTRDYCVAGAVESMHAPIDIMALNQTVQQIIQSSKDTRRSAGRARRS